jgi:hypothetical protein
VIARVWIDLERAKGAPVVVDGRFPVPAAACPRSVYLRPDATAAQRRRAVATWLLASSGQPFTSADVASVEMLL